MAQYEEFTIDQGADVAIVLELLDPETNSAKDLAGYSVAAKMKRSFNSDLSDTTEFNAIISDSSGGKVTLSLTNTQTDALRPGHYLYDVELSFTDVNQNVIIERVLEGRILVSASVTR